MKATSNQQATPCTKQSHAARLHTQCLQQPAELSQTLSWPVRFRTCTMQCAVCAASSWKRLCAGWQMTRQGCAASAECSQLVCKQDLPTARSKGIRISCRSVSLICWKSNSRVAQVDTRQVGGTASTTTCAQC